MDWHVSADYQTECPDITSKNIKDYFIDNFKKIADTNIVYDFMVEDSPLLLKQPATPYMGIYLDRIRKLFIYGMNINKEGVVIMSTKFPNIRFHYIDIRDYTYADLMHKLENQIRYLDNRYIEKDINSIKDAANILTARIKLLYNMFYKDKDLKIKDRKPSIPKTAEALLKYTDKDIDINLINFIYKILHTYSNDNIKSKINKNVNTDLKNRFTNYFDAANKLEKYITSKYRIITHSDDIIYMDTNTKRLTYGVHTGIKDDIAHNIKLLADNLLDYWMDIHNHIIDLYLLRRFLDKNYITNAITYTGAYHSVSYIYLLVKNFNFKITHYSYMKYNIEKTTELIKKAKSTYDISILFNRNEFSQCSDVSKFPKLFK